LHQSGARRRKVEWQNLAITNEAVGSDHNFQLTAITYQKHTATGNARTSKSISMEAQIQVSNSITSIATFSPHIQPPIVVEVHTDEKEVFIT